MTPKMKLPFIIFLLSLISTKPFAQADSVHPFADTANPLKIALLVPLYIDSAFNGFNYKLPNNNMPKYMVPGLDFYNGAMLAVDSLQKEGANIDVYVYDTKAKGKPIDALTEEMGTINFSLIIASFSNLPEQKAVAAFAFSKNIPVISATYPNDAYVTGNPFFVMLNSTLKTHVESIYKYVQKNFPVGKLIFVTRKGSMETRIKDEFTAMDNKTYALKYKVIELPDNFTEANLLPLMDSTEQNIIICGSLDENFGVNLVKALNNSALTYETTVMGMPTWDGLKALSADDCSNVQVVFSTPYNFSKNNNAISTVSRDYKLKYSGRAGDMVFKGFESMYHFTALLLKYRNDFLNNLSDPSFRIADEFIFEPVKLNASSFVPDYIENKKIYFVQQLDGIVKSVSTAF